MPKINRTYTKRLDPRAPLVFDTRTLRSLLAEMEEIGQDESPFDHGDLPRRDVHWVRPELVAQIGFSEWTRDLQLRHPRFQGLRRDKAASEVVREVPQ